MKAFSYKLVGSTDEATSAGTQSAFIAGGTNLVDLMKIDVMDPKELVDINQLPMRGVTLDSGGLRIGALEKMAYVAEQPDVVEHFPLISQALLKSASAQLRNMASIGGNLMQRTRCGYFRDVVMPCNKRDPGSGCPAFAGENRMHAILGVGNACCATHPSDLAVALVALDASIKLQGPNGTRSIKLDDFYLLPGDTPDREHDIQSGELITEVSVPRIGTSVPRISRFVTVSLTNSRFARQPSRSISMGRPFGTRELPQAASGPNPGGCRRWRRRSSESKPAKIPFSTRRSLPAMGRGRWVKMRSK
jgi:xanthine dehydrogenase YagS FAD-binding subunit